ncbi:MAG: type II toxin-antitoxin system VapC family toxin [Janthinobacterium lividum]
MDTHTLVWFAWDMPELPARVKAILEDAQTSAQVSIASFWEIGIKVSLGKWDLPGDVLALQRLVEAQGIEIIPITVPAIHLLTKMEHHHKDPFDRLIAATAITSGCILLSADLIFDRYGVTREWD